MKFEDYMWNPYCLRDFFETIRKLQILNGACYVAYYEEERRESGCRCGNCYGEPYRELEILLGHDDFVYSEERVKDDD